MELGAAWEYGHDAGRLEHEVSNWWRQIMRGKLCSKGRIKGGKRVGTSKRVLNSEEIGVPSNWLPNFSRLIEDVVTLYMWTCTRGSKILEMEVSEVTKEKGWAVVDDCEVEDEELVARRRDRLRVPLVGRTAAIFQRRIQGMETGYLLIHRAQWTRGAEHHQCDGLDASTVLEYEPARVSVSLRRTGLTQLTALGCDTKIAKAVIGHTPRESKLHTTRTGTIARERTNCRNLLNYE